MEYKHFLLGLSAFYAPEAQFTAKTTNENVLAIAHIAGQTIDWRCKSRLKAVSTYLSRLYHMQFLLRKKRKRVIKTKTGKLANRGYEFVYRFSEQGRKYVKYLQNPILNKVPLFGGSADFVDMIELKMLLDHIPDQMMDYAEEVCRVYVSRLGTGRYKRFPKRTSPWLYLMMINIIEENKALKLRLELKDLKIKELEGQ